MAARMAARIQPLARRQLPLMARLVNLLARRRFGREVDSLNIIAKSQGMYLPYLATSMLARAKTMLPPATKLLAMPLVSATNGCAWCLDFGMASAMEEGIAPDKLLAVLDHRTDDRFSDAERAALAYAETITVGDGHVSDAIFEALRPHFTEREIVELTVSIAIEHFFNRINGPLGIEAQGFCVVPTAFMDAAPSGDSPKLSVT